MITSRKIRLIVSKEQEKYFWQSVGCSRWAYNFYLRRNKEEFEKGNKKYTNFDCNKEIVLLKKTSEFEWLNSVDSQSLKYATKQAREALINFFKGKTEPPNFKSRSNSRPSFYTNYESVHKAKSRVIFLPKIGEIKCCEKLPGLKSGENYMNPTISYDGVYWNLSIGYETEDKEYCLTGEIIGIDLGIKELAVCSDKTVYKNINKSKRVKQLEKRRKRQQRKISRQYRKNKQGKKFIKTKNIVKAKKDLQKTQTKLNNIRTNYLHQITAEIVKKLPKAVVMEDLNIKGMMKNKHLAKSIAQQKFYEFRRIMEYKCRNYGIELVIADRFYASSKICSCCGEKKAAMLLHERTYICDSCGAVMDRDFNAAMNLRNYGIKLAK